VETSQSEMDSRRYPVDIRYEQMLENIFGPDTFKFRMENKNVVMHENFLPHFDRSQVNATKPHEQKQAPIEQLKKQNETSQMFTRITPHRIQG
jgi:hypothetical protein